MVSLSGQRESGHDKTEEKKKGQIWTKTNQGGTKKKQGGGTHWVSQPGYGKGGEKEG